MTDLAHTFDVDNAIVAEELERHRPGLTAHCYRMLGSAFEAEDALQETFIRAWRGFDRFEGRAELRSWLYRIATNVCLDLLKGRARRALPMSLVPPSSGDSDLGPPLTESAWVSPIPDRRVIARRRRPGRVRRRPRQHPAGVHRRPPAPPARSRARSCSCVTCSAGTPTRSLTPSTPPSPRCTACSVGRAAPWPNATPPATSAPALGESEWKLVARYVDAFQRFDIDALVALLRDDAIVSMPPIPGWLHGRAAIAQLLARQRFGLSRLAPGANPRQRAASVRLVPTRTPTVATNPSPSRSSRSPTATSPACTRSSSLGSSRCSTYPTA